MTELALEQVFYYRYPSALDGERGLLRLATSSRGGAEHPSFFVGTLTRPERTARLLLALMEVVRSRFHVPPALLEQQIALSDPVVTGSGDRLRFEGFSACCGAYARVDLHSESFEGEVLGRGTTNVDFNQPMLTALARIREGDSVTLAVGSEGVTLEAEGGEVVEKRVRLPVRWLRSLVEVQACQLRMEKRLTTSGPEAARFFRALPRMKTHRRATWIVPSGRGLRTSQVRPTAPAPRVGGMERLSVLARLASKARRLDVYADETTGATGWVLVFDDCRFHLLLSPEVWRGFSGEGQALEALAEGDWEDSWKQVRAQLGWAAAIDPDELARRAGVGPEAARAALLALGARGLVGFDLDAGAFFHRELPFDVAKLGELQPRWKAARRLLEEGRVRFQGRTSRTARSAEAFVESGDVEHRVRISEGQAKCSCVWFAKHATSRGPCKHVLAVRGALEDRDAEE